MTVTRAEVVAEARSWIGTPYLHQHRERGYGVDCGGLVIGVCRNLGLVAPDFDINGYERSPDGETLIRQCDTYMDRIALPCMRPGDVLIYCFDGKRPQHMGIVGAAPYGDEQRLTLIQALGTTDGKGSVRQWRITARKNWKPIAAYALRGVV